MAGFTVEQAVQLARAEAGALAAAQARAAQPGVGDEPAARLAQQAVVQFLQRYRQAFDRAEELADDILELKRLAGRVGPALEGRAACRRLEEAAAQLERQVERCLEVRGQVAAAIDAVPDEQQRRMLRLRYIGGLTWERVAGQMLLDERWVRRMHKRVVARMAAAPGGWAGGGPRP